MVRINSRLVFVIEDSPDMLSLLKELLESESYKVTVASNGKVALDILRNTDELPSVILLDLMMPIMDGYEFRQEQKKDPRLTKIPVVLMSADSSAHLKAEGLSVSDILRKPLDINEILELVKKYCA